MSEIYVTITGKRVKRVEGDIWEEGGKTWTIKNGLKRTVTKMDQARKDFLTPLACPKCQGPMKHHLDEKMWAIHRLCFNCTIDMEHEIVKAGKWAEYERAKLLANANSYLKDMTAFFEEYAKETMSSSHVTENGVIEKWKDVGENQIKDIGNEVTNKINKAIENYTEK
jgi:hypothetical protein